MTTLFQFNLYQLRDDCDCEEHFEVIETEQWQDEEPVSMNPFTDAITYQSVTVVDVTVRCRRCWRTETVEGEPDLCDYCDRPAPCGRRGCAAAYNAGM